jgi:RNA polymerase sigma-70 factor (ECF subfamily)
VSETLKQSDVWQADLEQARTGCTQSLGELLERFRPFLYQAAEETLGARFRSKQAPSDLVQQSFLEAHRDFRSFQGSTEEELLRWLRQILQNNLVDFARRYQETAKRDLSREKKADSTEPLHAVPARDPSPSQHASLQEQVVRLQSALAELDEEKQTVLRLRHHEQLTFAEIGRRIEKSEEAARKIWARAVDELRRRIKEI